MLRTVKRPLVPSGHSGIRPLEEGGLGGATGKHALDILAAIPASEIDQPNGPISVNVTGMSRSVTDSLFRNQITIEGPAELPIGTTAEYFITCYDSFTDYVVEGLVDSEGNTSNVFIDRNVILYFAPWVEGEVGFKVNGTIVKVLVGGPIVIQTPTIESPTEGGELTASGILTSSPYAATASTPALAATPHVFSEWQISLDEEFYNTHRASIDYATAVASGLPLSSFMSSFEATPAENAVGLTNWVLPELQDGRPYYLRVRYINELGVVSKWSPTRKFKMRPIIVGVPIIDLPPPGSVDLGPVTLFTVSGLEDYEDSENPYSIPRVDAAGNVLNYVKVPKKITHEKTDWELYVGEMFIQSASTGPGVYTVTFSGLLENTRYFIMARVTQRHSTPVKVVEDGGIIYDEVLSQDEWQLGEYWTKSSFAPSTPNIVAPISMKTNIPTSFVFETSVFDGVVGDEHSSTDWQLSTNATFASVAFESLNDLVNKTSWPTNGLSPATTYYLRARHRGMLGIASSWSPTLTFTTASTFLPWTPVLMVIEGDLEYRFKGSAYGSPTLTPEETFDIEITSGLTFEVSVETTYSQSSVPAGQGLNKNIFTLTKGDGVLPDSHYWARMRYRDISGNVSQWSAAVLFKSPVV